MTTNPANILGQTREVGLTINHNGKPTVFVFRFARTQIADLVDASMAKAKKEIADSRKWCLTGIQPDQHGLLLALLDDPVNFTIESKIMGKILPPLTANKAKCGELQTDPITSDVRTAGLPIFFQNDEPAAGEQTRRTDFLFQFSRSDIADISDSPMMSGVNVVGESRRWCLHGVGEERQADLLAVLDHPQNFTFESEIIQVLLPFFGGNAATLGAVETVVSTASKKSTPTSSATG